MKLKKISIKVNFLPQKFGGINFYVYFCKQNVKTWKETY
jgi:hypothetical protein